MNPTAIDQTVVDHYKPQAGELRVVTFTAPPGHEADTGDAQGVVLNHLPGQAYGHQISLPLTVSDEELTRLQSGEPVWLTFCTEVVVPFAVTVGSLPPVI